MREDIIFKKRLRDIDPSSESKVVRCRACHEVYPASELWIDATASHWSCRNGITCAGIDRDIVFAARVGRRVVEFRP